MTQTLAESPAPRTATTRKSSGQKYGWIIVFSTLGLFIVANIVTLIIEPWLMESRMYAQFQNIPFALRTLNSNPAPNVVFIGTSRVAQGLDPAIAEREVNQATGKKIVSLNLGIAGSDTEVNYLLLKNILKDGRKPDVIVYGLTETELLDKRVSFGELDYAKDTLLRLDDFGSYAGQNVIEQTSFLLKQVFPLYRDKNLIKDSLATRYNQDDPNYKFYTADIPFPKTGFRTFPRQLVTQDPQFMLNYYSFLAKSVWNNEKLDFLDKFVKLAQERNIKVVLLNMPVKKIHVALWKDPAKVALYQNEIKKVADKYKVPLLDLYTTGEELIPQNGFYDTNHFNQTGADVLTKYLAQKYLVDFFK